MYIYLNIYIYIYIYNVCVSVCVFMCTLFLIQIYLHISARYFKNLEENVSWFYSTKWTETPQNAQNRGIILVAQIIFF